MTQFGIGQSVSRFEDPRLLRGQGQFIDDHNLPGQAHAVLVRSPHAHARIKRIDTSLKERPSRFKFVREFAKPSREIRAQILGDDSEELLAATAEMTLDQVFQHKDKLKNNRTYKTRKDLFLWKSNR